MYDNGTGVYLRPAKVVNEKSKPSPKPATQPSKQPKEAPATKRFKEAPVRKSTGPRDPERP